MTGNCETVQKLTIFATAASKKIRLVAVFLAQFEDHLYH